jgi:hypothetical protein
VDVQLLAELTKRGVTTPKARRLLAKLAPGQEALDQLEYGDHLIAQDPGRIRNPAGLYIHFIEENVPVPSSFEPSRVRRLQEEKRRARQREADELADRERAYLEYQAAETTAFIARSYTPAQFKELLDRTRTQLLERIPMAAKWAPDVLATYVEANARGEAAKQAGLIPFEEFCRRRPDSLHTDRRER